MNIESCLVYHQIGYCVCYFVLGLSGALKHMEPFEDKRLISVKLDLHSAAHFLLLG